MASANTVSVPRDPPTPATHLAFNGAYRNTIEENQRRNPNLRYRDWKIPITRRDVVFEGRLKVIGFDGTGAPQDPEQLNSETLRDHFRDRKTNTSSPKRYLYLLEGLYPEYVQQIGSHFDIDPAFFSRHKRTGLWEGVHKGGNTGKLASADKPERGFMLEYPEVLYFEDGASPSMRNPDDNRHIDVSKKPEDLQSEVDKVGNMHRKASWWSKTGPNNSGWDVVMLVDPSLPKHDGDPTKFTVLVGSSRTAKPQPMSVEHYQGGYLDFEDFEGLTPAQRSVGPPRTSLMDDLCFYWKHHGVGMVGPSTDSTLPTTIFLQKIVSSNYMIFVGYLESCLNELETSIRLSHVDKGTRNMTLKVSELWSILQSWSHRFPEYCGMLDDILKSHAKLRPPSPSPNQPGPQPNARNWDGCFDDFEAISVKMNALRQRTELLAESFVGLASMAGMQESLDEARNVKILTLLGVFFLPLSWIASIFALEEHPDPKGFPLYSKIAFPVAGGMTLLVGLYIFWGSVVNWFRARRSK